MTNSINKTSILIPSQLPSFISEDVNYEKFVTFIQAYYEWMEQTGIVTSISIVNGGLGYSNPVVTINGDGTGATAVATLDARGSITDIAVTSYGSGYTQATVTITGQNTIPAVATINLQNGVTYDTKNLLNYRDIDSTSEKFINYFIKDFLPYFPESSLVSKDRAIKIARQIYKSKGTPASYKLLFRLLYNSDFEFFNTGDQVLKASSGTWFVPRSLSILSTDTRFLQTNGYRVLGETSKSFATIENSSLQAEKIQLFISDIERVFQSGETIRIVDNNNQDLIIDGQNLTAKIVGQLSSINVDAGHKGLGYQTGDPVIIYGGLNENLLNPIGASAVVGDTVTGSIQHISMLSGGQGYNLSLATLPNTTLSFSTSQVPGFTLPQATVVGVDTANGFTISNLSKDTVGFKSGIKLNANNFHFANGTVINVLTTNTAQTYIINETVFQGANLNVASFFGTVNSYDKANGVLKLSNVGPLTNSTITLATPIKGSNSNVSFVTSGIYTANVNSRLQDVLSFESFTGYPISQVFLESGGGGLTQVPTATALSEYTSDNPGSAGILGGLGILGPVKITTGGRGYRVNDKVKFVGGSGYGANATVTQVDANGSIQTITYNSVSSMPTGGLGYGLTNLPALTVVSANNLAANAVVYVDSIMGQGASFELVSSQVGQITNIVLTDPGQDYITTPQVSLRIQDIAITGITPSSIPKQFDTVYQGATANLATYVSTVYSVNQVGATNIDPTQTVYKLRVFNYTSDPNPNLPLISTSTGNQYFMTGKPLDSTWNSQGFIDYGDGTAIASAKFLNGLMIGAGKYLTSAGQLSSYAVIQSEDYNSFTYKITTEKEIAKYRSVLLNLVHPSGTKVIGRLSTTTEDLTPFDSQVAINKGNTLYHYTQTQAANATMYADANVTYSNTVQFNNLPFGTNIGQFIFANTSTLYLGTTNGPNVISMVTSVDSTNNIVTIADKTFLTFPNTFNTSYTFGGNVVKAVTNLGNYSFNDPYGLNLTPDNFFTEPTKTTLDLSDLLFAGDYIYVDSTKRQVTSVDYTNNLIYLSSNFSSNGAVFSIPVLGSGSGYDYTTLKINITGSGTGANAVPVLDANGNILSITVNAGGYGYANATASIANGANFHTQATLGTVTIAQTSANAVMTIVRNFVSGGSIGTAQQMRIYGPAGVQYFPQLTDESGNDFITEDGQFILLG